MANKVLLRFLVVALLHKPLCAQNDGGIEALLSQLTGQQLTPETPVGATLYFAEDDNNWMTEHQEEKANPNPVNVMPDDATLTTCLQGPPNTPELANSPFFTEHIDPNRPCHNHVCYPSDNHPFYEWSDRFDTDKCCTYNGEHIVMGQEKVLANPDGGLSECEETVVRCQLPDEANAPLIAVVEMSQTKCCVYNGTTIHPEKMVLLPEICSVVHCQHTDNRVLEIIQNVVDSNGQCCELEGKVIKNGWMGRDKSGQVAICHNGQMWHVRKRGDATTTTNIGVVQPETQPVMPEIKPVTPPPKPVLPSNQGSPLDDLSGSGDFDMPMLGGATFNVASSHHIGSETSSCDVCYMEHPEQARFKEMVSSINNVISAKATERVFFILNGKSSEHKYVGAALAADLPISEATRGYVTSYAFHDSGACSYYKWDQQCVPDNCRMARVLGGHAVEDSYQDYTSGDTDEVTNALSLAYTSMEHSKKNPQLPLCINDNDHGRHLDMIIMFITSHEDGVQMPSQVAKHAQSGCTVVIVTFNTGHYETAKQYASKGTFGQPLAFKLDRDGLQNFFMCRLRCLCNLDASDINFNEDQIKSTLQGELMMVEPVYIDDCYVTMFRRDNGPLAQLETMNMMSCEEFETAMTEPSNGELKLLQLISQKSRSNNADETLKDVVNSLDNLQSTLSATEQPERTDLIAASRHAGHDNTNTNTNDHADASSSFEKCMKARIFTEQNLLTCLHLVQAGRVYKRSASLEEYYQDSYDPYSSEEPELASPEYVELKFPPIRRASYEDVHIDPNYDPYERYDTQGMPTLMME